MGVQPPLRLQSLRFCQLTVPSYRPQAQNLFLRVCLWADFNHHATSTSNGKVSIGREILVSFARTCCRASATDATLILLGLRSFSALHGRKLERALQFGHFLPLIRSDLRKETKHFTSGCNVALQSSIPLRVAYKRLQVGSVLRLPVAHTAMKWLFFL